jgi:glycosyltransferase involved in cell wall biosynthesis
MRFSLIVATIGRTVELRRLFESLEKQSYRDFDVIVVDQNADDRLLPLIKRYGTSFPIFSLKSEPGLSQARNIGLRYSTGDVIAFPDDDCWYPPETLAKVAAHLGKTTDWDGILGTCVDEQGNAVLPWGEKSGPVTPAVSWRRSVTYAYFLRQEAVKRVGSFDETLGPGAGTPWGCGEDNDFMLRALKAGAHVQYKSGLVIRHPRMFPCYDSDACLKRRRYSMGDGRLLRKHPMPMWWRVLFFAVPLARMAWSLVRWRGDEIRFHWITFVGRVAGYWKSRKSY